MGFSLDTLGFGGIFKGFFKIHLDFVVFIEILWDSRWILWESMGFFEILLDFVVFVEILWDSRWIL